MYLCKDAGMMQSCKESLDMIKSDSESTNFERYDYDFLFAFISVDYNKKF